MYVRPRPRFRPRNAGGVPFSPALLFTSGVAGAWYDPSDYSTLFQDSAGTTPVTAVEQGVRLMLDKSQGLVLGSELVPTTYSGTVSGLWNIGASSVTRNGATAGQASFTITSMTASKFYAVSFTVSDFSGDSIAVRVGSGGAARQITGNGTFTLREVPSGSLTGLVFTAWGGSIGQATITNISVKELPGNHALAPNDPSRPILRARYNLLTYSEQFDNAAWTKTNVTLTANAIAAPDGTLTADNAAIVAATAVTGVYSNAGVTVSVGTFTVSCYVKANGVQYANVGFIYSSGIFSGTQFDLTNGTVVRSASANYTSPSATITPLSNGWYRCTHTVTVTTALIYPLVSPSNALWTTGEPRQSLTGDGTSGIYIWGADLRTGSSAGTYQRIAAATDYDTVGFLPYLYFVTDDSFGTNSIDFTATDKMSVCAGVTKLSDASIGMVAELSATAASNAGTFYIAAPEATGANYFSSKMRGTATATPAIATSASFASPVTVVATGLGDISTDTNLLRLNGTQVASNTTDQGAGNFGNYPLFIGRRNNASLPFNGNFYQLIVCGKTLSASELASTEAYVNQKTGAY